MSGRSVALAVTQSAGDWRPPRPQYTQRRQHLSTIGYLLAADTGRLAVNHIWAARAAKTRTTQRRRMNSHRQPPLNTDAWHITRAARSAETTPAHRRRRRRGGRRSGADTSDGTEVTKKPAKPAPTAMLSFQKRSDIGRVMSPSGRGRRQTAVKPRTGPPDAPADRA